ncbi:MAG: LysR family transcriptional regulator [Lachnospiraceae bacterium]|nr:LysR family transcriptional regulator [Lachnospiraceae bacterium]
MLDFRIKTFLEVCKLRSYTKAAETLCITQPAVTQHIKYLEQYYGGRLFEYVGRKIELTKNGKLLYQAALTMAADEEKIRKHLLLEEEGKKEFHFGSTLTIGEFVLPDLLAPFIRNNQDTSLSMIVDNTSVLLKKVRDGEIDFAFIEGYFHKEEYDYCLFQKDRFIAVTADVTRSYEESELEELLADTIIVRENGSGTREILERVLNENNRTIYNFKRVIEIGNVSAIKHFVKSGCGITFLYESAVRQELREKKLFEIPLKNHKISREFNFVMLKNSLYKEEYYRFFEKLKEGK